MERTCKKCGETKPIEEFERNKRVKSGYTYRCIICQHKYYSNRRIVNGEKIREREKIYYKKNKQQIAEIRKRYYEKSGRECQNKYRKKNLDHLKGVNQKWYIQNKNRIDKYKSEWYQNNSEILLKQRKEYYKENKEYIAEKLKEYRLQHKEQRRKYCEKNKEQMKKTAREYILNLTQGYMRAAIRQATGLSYNIIKQHPELIENYRQQIKLKRLIKTRKNENTETS